LDYFDYLCRMLKTEDIISLGNEASVRETWQGQLGCMLIHKQELANPIPVEGASIYSFVVVRQGRFTIRYNGNEIVLRPNDIHTYAPGMPTEVVDVSDDYEGYFLLIDEALVNGTPLMNHIVRAAYQPIAEFSKPVFAMNDEQAHMVWNMLSVMREHILYANDKAESDFRQESLLSLFQVFCIDLINIQDAIVEHVRVNTRQESLFSEFLQLIPDNFIAHHDLKFYADRLNISIPYLSRIVRLMSGRTVMSFIDHALATEASRRLKTTNQSVTDLAYFLNFSDQAAFTKFFVRMKGMSPREYRKD